MLTYITIGASLFFLAAAWPPHNVYVADAFGRKDRRTILLIALAVLIGGTISTAVVAAGASLAKLPIGQIGGVIVCITGIRMLLKRRQDEAGAEAEAHNKTARDAILASFFLALNPGVYAIVAAEGITKHDYMQTATVLLSDPAGVVAGGLLLAYGVRFVNIPLDKIGGTLVVLIGLKMMFF